MVEVEIVWSWHNNNQEIGKFYAIPKTNQTNVFHLLPHLTAILSITQYRLSSVCKMTFDGIAKKIFQFFYGSFKSARRAGIQDIFFSERKKKPLSYFLFSQFCSTRYINACICPVFPLILVQARQKHIFLHKNKGNKIWQWKFVIYLLFTSPAFRSHTKQTCTIELCVLHSTHITDAFLFFLSHFRITMRNWCALTLFLPSDMVFSCSTCYVRVFCLFVCILSFLCCCCFNGKYVLGDCARSSNSILTWYWLRWR